MSFNSLAKTHRLALSKVRFVITALIATLLVGVLTWAIVFKSIASSEHESRGKSFMFLGQVAESHHIDGVSYYRLRDFTGDAWVISQRGNPTSKNFIMLWGNMSESSTGRSTIVEKWRVGSF